MSKRYYMSRRQVSVWGIIIALIFIICIANAPTHTSNGVVVTPKPKSTNVVTTTRPEATKVVATPKPPSETTTAVPEIGATVEAHDMPEYNGEPYVVVNNNVPYFTKKEIADKAFEYYSKQDKLGRCGMVWACIGVEIMPTEKRGSIGHVRPAGWHTIKYDIIDGLYLYNRCHLIGYQLAGENDNINNLITGTRYLNVVGMLPFENQVAEYVESTKNHVMYRVTPIYQGDNLLANGVLMEGYSVEDKGEGICFNVFVYNVQPGIIIDYATGKSYKEK